MNQPQDIPDRAFGIQFDLVKASCTNPARARSSAKASDMRGYYADEGPWSG